MDNNNNSTFVWWMGVVENRTDPLMMGRVQVRIFGWHTPDKSLIPTESLPWSHPIIPINLSYATHAPKEGDWVFGFFADGTNAQQPMVMGVMTGYPSSKPNTGEGFADPTGTYPNRLNEPTTSRLARGRTDGTVQQTRKRNAKKGVKSTDGAVVWDEPASAFAPKYPRNASQESESGHALELDDSPGVERVALSHKIGTFLEYAPNGDAVFHAEGNSYRVIMGADYVSIEGDCNVTVGGNCNLKVNGKARVEAESIDMVASGAIKIKAGGALKMEGESVDVLGASSAAFGSGAGDVSLSGLAATIQGATVDVVAGQLDLQSPAATSAPSATGLSMGSSSSSSVIKASGISDLSSGGSLLGKAGVGSISVDGLYNNMSGAIDKGLSELGDVGIPFDKLSGSMMGLESNLNNVSGAALNLPAEQLNIIRDKGAGLVETAAQKGITIKLDPAILPYTLPAATITGKRLYPSTETITIGGVDYPIKG